MEVMEDEVIENYLFFLESVRKSIVCFFYSFGSRAINDINKWLN